MIPDSVVEIERYAFSECSNLIKMIIPDSVTSIGGIAFAHCTRLSNVILGNNIANIPDWMFYECISLKTIAIPASVALIEHGAFGGCTNLSSVVFGGNAPRFGVNEFTDTANNMTIYYYPDASGWEATFGGRPTSMKPFRILTPLYDIVALDGVTIHVPACISAVPPLAYQWYFDGRPLAGATNDSLTISPMTAVDAGVYMVIASNAFGAITNGPLTMGVYNICASNYFGLIIADSSGMQLQIQSAGNVLGPWTPLADLLVTNSPQAYIDFAVMNDGQRFYHPIIPPEHVSLKAAKPIQTMPKPSPNHC